LRKDVWRITVALEKMAGIESQDSDKKNFLWPESEGKETEIQRSKEKQREQSSDKAEEEKDIGEQEEKNGMEGVEESTTSFSLVAYSIGTGIL